ncbi:MAG: phosphoglucosamine mutase [Methylococcales bacterium]|nr:phosphoglucosamine mutase [Methylococcales bacterium]
MSKKYFGTDGIRGKVGEYPITADFALKLGWAIGRVFAEEGKNFVLIGKDTRISGYMFESALEAGLSAAGVNTHLLGPMPTPAIAYLTRTLRARAGIVISASHNPYYDNGVKFFSTDGTKLADALEHKIERYIDKPIITVESSKLGKAKRVEDAAGRYIEFCKSTVPTTLSLKGLNIVVDCANGATYHIAPCVFEELGANVTSIGVSPNGLNINHACGATQPQQLAKTVIEQKADLGIALDGDGDRLIMVDHKGEIVDGDELIYIIAKSRLKQGHQEAIVGTLMSNLGMEHALEKLGLSLLRANVGDRYVLEILKQNNALLGGEGSGHIICLDKTTTGDGIVAALQILTEIQQTGLDLHTLKQGMQKYPQVLLNIKVARRVNPLEIPAIQKAVVAVEKALGHDGRVLLRASGTEPLIRVMVEGKDMKKVNDYAQQLADEVKNAINA